LPSAFLLAACVSFFSFTIYRAGVVLILSYISFSFIALTYNVNSWTLAGKMEDSLEKDFRWGKAKHVYILNLPENFRGAYMYRADQPSSFAASFNKYKIDSLANVQITEVMQYGLYDYTDSVFVRKINDRSLQVTLSTWGIWFWYKTSGAYNYEDNLLKVAVEGYKHSYTVQFKNREPGDVIIYAANGKWRELSGF
jgi:hypothetical protein